MLTPVTYSPTLACLLDAQGNRIAACSTDSVGKALALSVNAVLMLTLSEHPASHVNRIASVDPMASAQLCDAAHAVGNAWPVEPTAVASHYREDMGLGCD